MINVYFFEPCSWLSYLGWHDVFLETSLHLKDKYNAKIIHKQGQQGVEERLQNLYLDHASRDCELIIYDDEKDILKAISFCESRGDCWDGKNDLWKLFTERNKKEDIFLVTQFSSWLPKEYIHPYNFTLHTTPFYIFTPYTNPDFYWRLRKFRGYNNLVNKMFFLSTTRREDPFALREMGLSIEAQGNMNIDEYLNLAIQYKVGLAISSASELCYRDIEYMAIGLPMLRLEYVTQTNPPLIPNYHYIAIDRAKYNLPGSPGNLEWGSHLDREGGEIYVQAYKERFLEVKDDYNFLEFISNNAREYYNQYCSSLNRLSHLLKLLDF
jgi:hypothetical protein